MKEKKKRSVTIADNEKYEGNVQKGENSYGSTKGDNSEQVGMATDLRNDMSEDSSKNVVNINNQTGQWTGQNGHSKFDRADFMVLPEVFTTYNGVEENVMTSPSKKQEEVTDITGTSTGTGNDSGFDKTEQDDNKVEIKFVDGGINSGKDMENHVEDQKYLEETIPLGSEAQSFEKSTRVETSQLEVPVDKRLKWLLGNLDQNSFGSDFSQNTATSNSSDISVDMLLQERTDDPEEILVNLGFGDADEVDNPIDRIPERFIIDNSQADGVSISDVLTDNPEFSHLLQAISDQPDGAENLDLKQTNFDTMMTGHGNPNYGNMLSSVMHGMKFLNLLSSAKSLNNLAEKSDEHPSILQNPKNREFLAQQGFYERHKLKQKTDENSKSNRLVKSQSLDASEKRKRFQATKSRNYSSLTNVPEQEEVFDSRKANNYNYQSFGTSFGTARTSRSMTSMETSTDSFDSIGSPGYSGRHDVARSNPNFVNSEQYNIVDSGIWNTQDSQRSIDEEYLAECSGESSAVQRKSQVKRMMSADSYNVGDDIDILKSPPLSRTGSLESTLTPAGFRKLENKSSTLKDNDSFEEDIESYSEAYLGESMRRKGSGFDFQDGESIQKTNANPNICLIQPENVPRLESVSGWTKFQKRYGVEMSVKVPTNKMEADIKVPANKIEADVVNNNYEVSQHEIPLDQTNKLDKPGLESIGKIESVQSDSSGFAEAEQVMPEPQVIQKVSSLGSSTESFKSSITILPNKSSAPKMRVSSPDGTHSISLDVSVSEDMNGADSQSGRSKMDVCVGTDDFSEYLHAPTISYHLHERDGEDSGTCSESDKSVILTIELPKNWVNTNPNKKEGKPRVVSHLYKEIGHGRRSYSVELDTSNKDSDEAESVVLRRKRPANYPLIRTSSDGNVPPDFPHRSSTPFGHMGRNLRNSLINADPSAKRTLLLPSQIYPRSSSPTGLSVISDYGPLPGYSDTEQYDSEPSLNVSSVSLVSKPDSTASVCNNSLEYYKLMKLVNQPVSFKNSLGQKGLVPFEPKFSVKKWTQLRKQQQLEEETKLVQHTLKRYKAELNMMESQFSIRTQLVKDDLSYGDKEDVQELQYLWSELRREVLEMEQTLANRLGGIHMGNDNYSPLLALDVVRKMTDLLREQIYQQQMTQDKDEKCVTTTPSISSWPSGSQQILGSTSDVGSEQSFNTSLAELKETILSEVKQELHDNTQWLHRELQKKERELNALKLELMSSSIKAGTTRKKHFFESDV